MNTRKPPVLEQRYVIPALDEFVSIDELVKPVLARGEESPVVEGSSGDKLAGALPIEPPEHGTALYTAIDELLATAGGHYRKNSHPGMFAFVASPGLPTDPLAHALTASLNQNVTGFHSAPGAALVEHTLIRWMCQLAGLPTDSGGLALAGGSWANLTALAVAMHHALGPRARMQGIHGGPKPIILAAETAHFSIRRAARVLGIGDAGIEVVPVDEAYRMDVEALQTSLSKLSNNSGRRVCCVVASAGTTAIGAIDPLVEIANICGKYDVWLHVDAAYGGAALLSDKLRNRLTGIENADSIAIDLHKWCYLAFDGSLLLYRNPELARDLFAFDADYVQSQRGQDKDTPIFFDLSPELSRRSRALPAYLAWRHYGLERLGRNIQNNAECAAYLAYLASYYPDTEKVAEPQLSICCFRYSPEFLRNDKDAIDRLNELILVQINQNGDFLLSSTTIDGRPVLRVCICSHTTRAVHMSSLIDSVRKIGGKLAAKHCHRMKN